jgi:hypothetical protein
MNEAQQQRLSANIHLLGDMLGETIIEQEGQAVFDLEEQIRALSKAWRAGDPEARLSSLSWARAARLPLALLTPDMQNRRILNQTFAAAGVEAQPRIEANSVLVLVSHVIEAGLGAILPLKTIELFLSGGQLAAVPLTEPDTSHAVGLIAPHRGPHTPVLEALLREARAIAVMEAHFGTVLAETQSYIRDWDVLNEIIANPPGSDNPSPTTDDLRPTIWSRALGPAYIERALRMARGLDATLRLTINDYGVEDDTPWAEAKRQRGAQVIPLASARG